MELKNNIFLKLSKLKKNELIQLAKKNNITINLDSKKDDLVNLLFYCANKNCYRIPKVSVSKVPLNGQVYSEQGERPTMEDTHLIAKLDDISLYGVFDGHGGNDTSDLLPSLITKYLLKPLTDVNIKYNQKKITEHIKDSFLKIDDELENTIKDESGSTSIMALVIANNIYIINLGDSRAIIYKKHKKKNTISHVFSSKDHKPDDPIETNRIYQMGGFVEKEPDDDARVNGYLALSRAFGDFELKPNKSDKFKGPLSVEPDIKIINKHDNYKYYGIIACDGLTDVVDDKSSIQYVEKFGFKNGAQNLVNVALQKNSTDNVSVIVSAL